ncbi:hypothetical protein CsSME_00053166 [Camellia sinensis var. sinensis]
MAMMEQFFQSRQFKKSFNATFSAWIPKKGGLLESVNKLLAKVLANRLRGVLKGVSHIMLVSFWMRCWWLMSMLILIVGNGRQESSVSWILKKHI